LRVTGFLDRIRQGFYDLLLGIIDVAQRMHEQAYRA
jgi:hypothetical protein